MFTMVEVSRQQVFRREYFLPHSKLKSTKDNRDYTLTTFDSIVPHRLVSQSTRRSRKRVVSNFTLMTIFFSKMLKSNNCDTNARSKRLSMILLLLFGLMNICTSSSSSSSSSFSSSIADSTAPTKAASAASAPTAAPSSSSSSSSRKYGRISDTEYILTPEEIIQFHRDGCVTLNNVLRDEEVEEIAIIFDKFISGEIQVPGKDFCDMSKPFGIPYKEWSLVNCMLPTTYYPPLRGNIYERLTSSIAHQLFNHDNNYHHHHDDDSDDVAFGDGKEQHTNSQKETEDEIIMMKDYDQFLNKKPGKSDAIFSWHQDMAYWPGCKILNVDCTTTCTFSLAIDDSLPQNGCLRYIPGSGRDKVLRPHHPMMGSTSREESHALVTDVNDSMDTIQLAPAKRGSVTIHDEYVIHGSGGNTSPTKQRRTYVLAYRDSKIVTAERRIGFTHSHNDEVNWDTFADGESHRIGKSTQQTNKE